MNHKQLPKPQPANVTAETLSVFRPLHGLQHDHLKALQDTMELRWLFTGDELLAEGQFDTHIYYLLYGTVEYHYSDGRVSVREAYQQFTPLANDQPRPCRVVAAADCGVVVFDREHLDTLLTWSQVSEYLLAELACNHDLDEDADWMDAILRSNLFLKVPPTNVAAIFQYVTSQTVYAGEVIIRQGELGDCCYFIKEGCARVTRNQGGEAELLADIGPGRCFGEDALVQETVRNASVTMSSDGVLMVLQKQHFLELLKAPRMPSFRWSDWKRLEDKLVMVDVRTEAEYNQGHFPGAINIPLSLLSLKRRLLPLNKSLVLYCDSGRRSTAATYLLIQQGIGALCLKGGLQGIELQEREALLTQQNYLLRNQQVVAGH